MNPTDFGGHVPKNLGTLNLAPLLNKIHVKLKVKTYKDYNRGSKSACELNSRGPFINWLCDTRLTPSLCTIIVAARPLHTP